MKISALRYLTVFIVSFSGICAWADVSMASPDGQVVFTLLGGDHLRFQATFRGQLLIDKSPLGTLIDGVDLGEHPAIGKSERYKVDERYGTRGVHSDAINHCNGLRISLRASTLDVRAYNDGIAFRFIVPGDPKQWRTPDAATGFVLPEGSTVWYHDLKGHYEGVHIRKDISEISAGDWAAVPLIFKLPNGGGYGSITESALIDYSGMVLQADGQRTFRERLGHAPPASYPYTLRYGEEEAKRLSTPASVEGVIRTPWRVVMAGRDLNSLVNSDLITNLAPLPDPKLFPQGYRTEWIKPGRSLWRYLDGGDNSFEGMKEYAKFAQELGFEYNLLEGFWQKWSNEQLRELVDYSKQRGVKLILWMHSKEIRDPAKRRAFFQMCHDSGVAGAKIDFFDHEAKEVVDLYPAMLKDAAEFHLIVDFHGSNKPTGESRTWPNELTREGIFGLEHRNQKEWAQHNTTLPFTRLLAGPADYTPMIFGERRKETSWAHQIASAAILTSPLLVYGAHPKSMLENPAVEVIKSIPSVWDETVVLPISEIGEIAAFARRSGNRWFLAIMNGLESRSVRIDLSFLGKGKYQALLIRDEADNAAAVKLENAVVSRDGFLEISLRGSGGFVGRFSQ